MRRKNKISKKRKLSDEKSRSKGTIRAEPLTFRAIKGFSTPKITIIKIAL
jgi:hypothetical protein